jgi:acyl carrier protein
MAATDTPPAPADQVLDRVVELVRQVSAFVDPTTELDPGLPLKELGVDSFGLVDLLSKVEDEFGVLIPDELLGPETFQSAAALTATVLPLLASDQHSPDAP